MHKLIASRSARPALLGAFLITAGGIGWHYFLPAIGRGGPHSASALERARGAHLRGHGRGVLAPVLRPVSQSGLDFARFRRLALLFGIAAFSTGEFIREAVRKPYVVYNVVLGNQIMARQQVPNQPCGTASWKAASGRGPLWASTIRRRSPTDTSTAMRLSSWPPPDRIAMGKVMFQYHCNDCHAAGRGLFGARPVVAGTDARDGPLGHRAP